MRGRRVHRQRIEDRTRRIYQKKDNVKLRIAVYLNSKNEGSYKNEIIHKAGLRGQHWSNFQEILLEMERSEWIAATKYADMKIYKITNKGRSLVSEAFKLIQDKNPLMELDTFDGIEVPTISSLQ